jgi:hypothetical protein
MRIEGVFRLDTQETPERYPDLKAIQHRQDLYTDSSPPPFIFSYQSIPPNISADPAKFKSIGFSSFAEPNTQTYRVSKRRSA